MEPTEEGAEASPSDLNIDETFAAFTGSDFAVSEGPMNLAPNMIGDFFGGRRSRSLWRGFRFPPLPGLRRISRLVRLPLAKNQAPLARGHQFACQLEQHAASRTPPLSVGSRHPSSGFNLERAMVKLFHLVNAYMVG